MTIEVKGRRIDADPNKKNQFPHPKLEPGDYGKSVDGIWFCRPPWKDGYGSLAGHKIVEHDDGTITVSPSILIKTHVGTWHGFLKKGFWKEC